MNVWRAVVRRRGRSLSRRLLLLVALAAPLVASVALLAASGCSKSDKDVAQAAEALPPLHLTDDTPELLLTWIDQRGAAHTSVTVAEVPAGSREQVRVVTKEAGHGALLYIADLSHKRADGSYPVVTMSRTDWEALLATRRQDFLAQRQPAGHLPAPGHPPAGNPGQPAPAPSSLAAPSGDVSAIVYGASWCGPCHQAADYMKHRGVHVIEHDIEKSAGMQREMQTKLQRAGRSGGSIPVIDIEGTILIGFSTRAIDLAIQKANGGTML